MEQHRPSTEAQASCLKMSARGDLPRTILDLPDDVFTEIFDLINAGSLMLVGSDIMPLLLSHSRFLEAAQVRVLRHQSYIKSYSAVTIDTVYGSGYDMYGEDGVSRIEEMPSSTTFDSAVMMLIAMHKDLMLGAYVRSLNYIVCPEASVQGADRRRAALEEFGSSEVSLQAWLDGLEPVVDTQAARDTWVRHLLARDNGEGLAILLKQLPQLQLLRLAGYRYRWLGLSGVFAEGARVNHATRFGQYSGRSPLPSLDIQRLVLCNVHRIPDAFFAFEGKLHATQSIRQLVIHCDAVVEFADLDLRSIRGCCDDCAWLKIPDIKVYGYQGGISNLANAIRRVQPDGFRRMEVVFSMRVEGGIPQAVSEIGPSFKIAGLQKPTFSNESWKRIKMVLIRGEDRKHDNPKGSQSKARPSLRMSQDEFET